MQRYFDTFNCLGMIPKCARQEDRQTFLQQMPRIIVLHGQKLSL